MADELSTLLSLFANYSNFYSVLSVLICFCVMVIFILRLNGENLMSSTATHYYVRKEQKMVSVHNPFSVQLSRQKVSTLKGQVNLDITVSHSSQVFVVWGVDIQAFQRELQSPTGLVLDKYRNNEAFQGEFLHWSPSLEVPPGQSAETMCMEVPDSVTEESLGQPPRHRYPLIVVTLLTGNQQPTEETAIVLQYTIFHLKDSVCTLDSHIVYQFVKTNQSSVLSLQPIFMSSSEPDNDESTVDMKPCSQPNQVDEAAQHDQDSQDCKPTTSGSPCTCPSDADTPGPKATADDTVNDTGVEYTSARPRNTADGTVYDTGVEDISALCDTDVEDTSVNNGCETEDDEVYSCIVCQSAKIVYTLLPCRHACVCSSCIKQLDQCPMCRGYFGSFFRLQDFNEVQSDEREETAVVRERFFSGGFDGLNNRLNQMLGFHEN